METKTHIDELLDARAEGYREGVNASRYDFDRVRKIGFREGFRCGFFGGGVVIASVMALLIFA